MSFSDLDFYLQQREDDRKWLQPVIFAVVVHIVTFGLSATLPELLNRKPILDEVVTVSLVSLPEDSGPQFVGPPPEAETKEAVPVEKSKVAVPIPVEEKVIPKPVKKAKPVSIKPIKRKVRKTDPKKIAQEEAKKKREQERLKAVARAKQEEEKAKQAAEDARSALAEMIRSRGVQQSASSGARKPSGGRQVGNIVQQNYYAALYDRIQQFWILPEMRHWSSSLETRVVVTIRRDGSIARTVVEKKSGDPYFDQYAMKTLQKAVPLPRFPKLMTQRSIEVGFRFRPGELSTM